MAGNLASSFKLRTLKDVGKAANEVVHFFMAVNKKTGAKTARVVYNNRNAIIQTLTQSGITIDRRVLIPEIFSKVQRDSVVLDLLKNNFTQAEAAAIMNISQSTVSRIANKY